MHSVNTIAAIKSKAGKIFENMKECQPAFEYHSHVNYG